MDRDKLRRTGYASVGLKNPGASAEQGCLVWSGTSKLCPNCKGNAVFPSNLRQEEAELLAAACRGAPRTVAGCSEPFPASVER